MSVSFGVQDKVAVVTGGAGVLCATLCRALAEAGAKVVVLDLRPEPAEALAAELGNGAIGIACNVLEKPSIESAAQKVLELFGRVDILINGAGGNKPQATTNAEQPFFDLPADALRWVFDLNLMGTILPSQVFGKVMAEQKHGIILNISSMNAFRPLTRIAAYSAAKAGVSNFTEWLAVHMAQEYSPEIRVNAIAPGFFVGEQNRRLLLNEDGSLTPRGQTILNHTPMDRFGNPDDLIGAAMWLVSPASSFVTGIVVPIDGGFSAFSGV
ncbi:MAG: SDR family oxidoreductase [Chloroflexi bacterium]|nr:SDR family oxidoreductase [Chloroflexota bacterium]